MAVVSATDGSRVGGGAEVMLRELAEGFAARGWEVDLLTTTVTDIYTWENTLPEGSATDGALTVRRFNAAPPVQREHDRIGARIMSGERLISAEEYLWVNSGPRMPGLFEYVTDHHDEYRAIVCGPYMFWMSLVLADLAPERTILMPCLHDEPPAGLEVYRYEMQKVAGLWFQSEPERELAQRLGVVARNEVVGSGIAEPPEADPVGFCEANGLDGPFLLYAGRREWGKGWPQLLEDLAFVAEALPESPPLLTCGVGEVGSVPPPARIVDLGVLSQADLASAQAAAAAYVQPSAMESFSRTVLESFQLSTPVIANHAGEVVRWHCQRSGAGVTYSNRYELAEFIRLIHSDPEMLKEMGAAGPDYVESHYRWPSVLSRAEATLEAWL